MNGAVIKYLGLSYCGQSVLPRENNAPPRRGHRCDKAALVCFYARLGSCFMSAVATKIGYPRSNRVLDGGVSSQNRVHPAEIVIFV